MSAKFDGIQFNIIDGVTSRQDTAIKKNFDSLSLVAQASPKELMSIRGINERKAADIKNYAIEKLAGGKSIKTKIGGLEEEDDIQLVMVERRIDRFTTLRTRVELNPAICIQCGFDLISENGLEDWDDLDEVTRSRIIKDMEIHSAEFHSLAQEKVVSRNALLEENQKKRKVLSPVG